MLALKPFRTKAAGLPDLLNFAALIDEGIVLGKDGSLLAGFFFKGDDSASATNAELNSLGEQVNKHIARFGSGWCIWVDAARLPSPGYPAPSESHFPDPISALIDAERREMFEGHNRHYETEYALLLQYIPPMRKEAKVGELMYDDESQDKTSPGSMILADFKKKLVDFQDGLGDALNMVRMGSLTIGEGEEAFLSDALINYLHFALTGNTLALRVPDCPMYLDSWLGMDHFWPGNTPLLGDKYIACVAIEGFPSFSTPGILSIFDALPIAYRWSSRFIFLDQHEALGELGRYHRVWTQQIKGWVQQIFNTGKGIINTDALKMSKEVESSMSDAHSDVVRFGYYTPVVVLMDEDRQLLEEQARYVKKEIERFGFSARVETVNTVDAFLGTLPGHPYPNVRRPLIHTLNLADLLPLSGIWPGLRENPCGFYPAGSPPLMHAVTTGATPFRVNLHVGDVGHTKIFGPTGAGKSTLLATLLAQSRRYPNATVTAFDKGGSLYTLCSAMGGTHYDIGADNTNLALCPLVDIDKVSDAIWAEEWIATCYELQADKPLTPNQKNEVHRAITLLKDEPRHARSLTHFVTAIQAPEVRDALKHYTLSGGMGHLLDGDDDDLKLSSFTVFEIDELLKLGNKNALPVLLYLFRRFEKSLTGQPAFLSLDEAWVMLGHPVFREKLREWLKELRKKNCAVIIATQSLTDAVSSGLLDVLIEQCPTTILLPNKEADSYGTKENPGPAQLYAMFGLNDREIGQIKHATYKRQYYYKSPLGRRWFELGLGPLALSFVAVSDLDTLREVRSYEEAHGGDWPLHWLRKKGVDYGKYTR